MARVSDFSSKASACVVTVSPSFWITASAWAMSVNSFCSTLSSCVVSVSACLCSSPPTSVVRSTPCFSSSASRSVTLVYVTEPATAVAVHRL